MKRLGDFKDQNIALGSGVMDGRAAAGEASANDYRLLLNVGTHELRGRRRMDGWTAWASETPSNEDLHDQLLGGQGVMEGDTFVTSDGQREAITLLSEARSSNGTWFSIAATKSRLYASTGQGRNWRILADGLAGGYTAGDSAWPNIRLTMAQIGDYLLFTNNVDPVLAWPLGGAVIAEGDNAARRWAAFEVYDLQGLDINRAGVVASWNGFAFIGDVTESGTRYPSRVYWSDAGAPLEWAPGGESLSGYVELGTGEQILTIAPVGGQLRVYTDRAIYSVSLVGGDAVFQFQEIYRGDLSLAFTNSFVNMGDVHMWLVQDSIVALGAYDRVPNRYEWAHRAAGFIFNGMDGRITDGCPVDFTGFSPLDKSKCHQIASGYDSNTGNVWISWPTQLTSSETPDDAEDFEGVRRLTLIINPRYQKATIVDHGFTAFALMRFHTWSSVRDFMVENGVCLAADVLSDDALLSAKEGFPLNTLEAPTTPPTCIWNETENPDLPKSDNSLAARVCGMRLSVDCQTCVSEPFFAMASAKDFSIKKFDISSKIREYYLQEDSPTWIPTNNGNFPNVVQASYSESGYPTLIVGESSQWGLRSEKLTTRLVVDYDAETQTTPGKLCSQIGVSNSPKCIDWHNSAPITMDCLQAEIAGSRHVQPAMFPYHRSGAWVAYRLYVASETDGVLNYSPPGCGVTLDTASLKMRPRSETWSNK